MLGGAVILLQTDRAGAAVVLFKVEDIGDVRATETIDTLVIVADNADVLMPRRKQTRQLILQTVGVLILVDKDIAETLLIVLAHIRLTL